MADKLLDGRNLRCPLPILKTIKALKEVPVGGTLELLATDPGVVADVEAFCEKGQHRLITSETRDGEYRFVIERGR